MKNIMVQILDITKVIPIPIKEFNVLSINSIKYKYKVLRQNSKAPTFALNYAGTAYTLIKNCGFSVEQATTIEKRYHEYYSKSDEWVSSKIEEICKSGHAVLAFGLKLRAPILSNTIYTSTLPRRARAEARSIGNALSGQSYCMLNNRALIDFMDRVWHSLYRYDIKPCILIHDALYFTIKRDLNVIKFINDNLIECMQWQELPEIQHDIVKLGAELDIFYPSWNSPITIKNNVSKGVLLETIEKGV
jgi:DNA polymerase-1